MAKANFNLQKFVSQSKQGFARTNRFEVLITPPPVLNKKSDSELVSIFAEVSNLPPLNLTVRPFKTFGPLHQRPISSDYGGDGLAMTFHLDSGMRVKRFFDDWMESIVSRGINGYPQFSVRYQADYITSIVLRQLSPNPSTEDDVSYEVELLEAFPRSMNLVEFNNAAQNQTQRLTIVFAYRYWRRTDIPKQPTAQISVQQQPVQPLPVNQVNAIKQPAPKNVTYTGQYNPGTTNEDMAFGVGQLSG